MSPHLRLASDREALQYCHHRLSQIKQRELVLIRLRCDLHHPHLELISRLLGATLRRLAWWQAEYDRLLLACIAQTNQPQAATIASPEAA